LKHEDTNAVFYRTPQFSIQTHEKNIKKKEKKLMYKLEMVFKRQNHEFLFQKLLMHWIEGNSNMKKECCILRNPTILYLNSWKKKKINAEVGNGFQTSKPWTSVSKTIYAMNWRGFKHEVTNAVFYWTPPFCIQSQEKSTKK